jgi:RNA polymerase sigma-70 factor (ECF subfamily)
LKWIINGGILNAQENIKRLKDGDIGGLEYLVRTYQVRAIRSAFLITQDAEMAEDIVQETFLKLYQRINQFDDSRPFEPYLIKSVINAALKSMRRSGKNVSFESNLSLVERIFDKAESVETQVEIEELNQSLYSALSQLSPRQRAVIVQRYYLGMSEEEMSQSLDVAQGTIKWHLHAARTRLKTLLAQKGGDNEAFTSRAD